MKRILHGSLFIWFLFLGNIVCLSQTAWYNRWGLLPEKTLDLLINEASGERAYNTIFDLSEPLRKRTSEEYNTYLFESQYVTSKLTEYALEDIKTEKLSKINVWSPVEGELTEVSPQKNKIADIDDIPFVLHPLSTITSFEGELVFVGDAGPSIIDQMDLKGKIVLTSSRPDRLISVFLQKEVAGVVSFYSSHELTDPLVIDDRKVENIDRQFKSDIFIFKITQREGQILRDRLLDREKIIVHASVRYRTVETDLQVTSCIIRGTDPGAGELIISAHLFEGYGVQGANDNLSGSAAILEIARVLNKLITEGKIARPARTIRFLWVPEYSGTIPWVNMNLAIIRKSLCNLNLDMVGIALSKYQSYFVLHRTSYGNAHYVNDVLENYYRYVSENNQSNSVISGSKFFKPIVAPSGTYDPFYYLIESTSGGSDHDIFNDWGVGVPGVLLITWPDPFYHTSEDRVDKQDPTQLKRVVFLTAAGAYTIAHARENEAVAIAGEVYGNAVRRLGYQVSMAGDKINKANADTLSDVLRSSIGRIKGTAIGESMTINSVTELAPSSQYLREMTAAMQKSISDMAATASENLTGIGQHLASVFGMVPITLAPSREEKTAAETIPKLTDIRKAKGYSFLSDKLSKLSNDVKSKYPIEGYIDYEEAALCINGKNSILDIKYLLDAQRDDLTSISDLVSLFKRMETAGILKY